MEFVRFENLGLEISRLENELIVHKLNKSKVEDLTQQLERARIDHRFLAKSIESFKRMNGLW